MDSRQRTWPSRLLTYQSHKTLIKIYKNAKQQSHIKVYTPKWWLLETSVWMLHKNSATILVKQTNKVHGMFLEDTTVGAGLRAASVEYLWGAFCRTMRHLGSFSGDTLSPQLQGTIRHPIYVPPSLSIVIEAGVPEPQELGSGLRMTQINVVSGPWLWKAERSGNRNRLCVTFSYPTNTLATVILCHLSRWL